MPRSRTRTEPKIISILLIYFLEFPLKYSNYLARRGRDHEVSIHILFAELLCNIQTQRAIIIVDISLRLVTQDAVRSVHLFELQEENRDL